MDTIDVFLSVRPSPSVDELDGAGYFWIIIEALVHTSVVEDYIERSETAQSLNFQFVGDTTDLHAVPFPDDLNIQISLAFPTAAPIDLYLPRRDAYRFVDRDGFVDLNRSGTWTSDYPDSMGDIDPAFDRSPSFRNEALRILLRRAAVEGESADFKAFLLRSSGLGASRIITDDVFDRQGLDDQIMRFDDGLSAGWRTNQHSLDGQVVRCAIPPEDPTEIAVTLDGDAFHQTVPALRVASMTLAKEAHLSAFLKSPVRVPEISVAQSNEVANRLYAHGRWEIGSKRITDSDRLDTICSFADVTLDPNSPCAGARGRSVLRIVAPDTNAKWTSASYGYLNFVSFRQVSGRLRPYRGFKAAGSTDNRVWVFEPRDGSGISERMFSTSTLQAVVRANTAGTVLYENQQSSLLQFLGTYNFPWEGTFDRPKPVSLFWSARNTVAACDVVLIFECGYGGGSLARQSKTLPREKGQSTYWQADDDDGGQVPEDANCVIVTDSNGRPVAGIADLTIQILRIGAVDFELANSAARYESQIDSMAYAPQYTPGSGNPVPKPGFGAFNNYSPQFSWPNSATDLNPYQVASDALTNPISTDWPGDIKRSTYHLSLRQRLWDDPASSTLSELADKLYGSLGRSLKVAHVFQNPLGQSAEAMDSGSTFAFSTCHFSPITKAANIRFNSSTGVDTQFWLFNFDEMKQELVLSANLDALQGAGGNRVSAWMAWRYIAELANAVDLALMVDLRYFDSSEVVAQVPATAVAAPVLRGFTFDVFDGTISLNSYKPIFLDWLKNPPAGGVQEVGRFPLTLKGLGAKVNEVAHAIRVALSVSRADATLPLGWAHDHILAVTYRPGFDVWNATAAPAQANDTALLCSADQWLAAFKTNSSFLIPSGGQVLSLTALATEQSDEAPEFFIPFQTPPVPASGEVIATLLPVAARPLARHDQIGVLTGRVVERLFDLLAMTIDCGIPSWWRNWTASDWQTFFSNLPMRGDSVVGFGYIVEALIDLLVPAPSAEGQNEGIGALISMMGGRLQERDPRLRAQIGDLLWSNLGEGHQISFSVLALLAKEVGTALPTDLWQMSFALGSPSSLENPQKATIAVTDVSNAVQLAGGGINYSFAVLSPLSRARFKQSVALEDIVVLRGAAATNPNASGNQAQISILRAELPGGNDAMVPTDPRVEAALPLLSQFIPPQFLSAARRQIEPGASGLFPGAGALVSARGLEAGSVFDPQGAGDTSCVVLAVGKSAQRPVSRYDTSIRVASFKIILPQDAGSDPVANVYFELLGMQPPTNEPSYAFDDLEMEFLTLLSGDGALQTMPYVADFQPASSPYQFYTDSSLMNLLHVGQPYAPMDDFRLLGLRWEKGSSGVWAPRFELSSTALWAEAALSQAVGGGDEYYLSIVLQLPVWYQDPVWLRQTRGLFAVKKVGPLFIEHGTVAVTGFETAVYASADYGSDPVLGTLPELSVGRGISVSDLINTLLVGDAIDPSAAWGQFETKGMISHRMKPRLPVVGPNGVSASDSISPFADTASYPLTSIYSAIGNAGSIPFNSGHVDMTLDLAWYSFGSSSPFYEVKGRKFTVN